MQLYIVDNCGGGLVSHGHLPKNWPNSTADKIATFILNEGGGVYAHKQMSRQLKDLAIPRKVGSTEAYEAFTPNNILRAELF